MNLQADLLLRSDITRYTDHDIIPTFVDDFACGNAIGVGFRSYSGWWKVTGVKIDDESKLAEVRPLSKYRASSSAPKF